MYTQERPGNLANTQHAPGQVIGFSSVQLGTWKHGRSSQKERIWSPKLFPAPPSSHKDGRTFGIHPTRAWSPRCSSGQTFFAPYRNQRSIGMICNMETSCKPRFGGTSDTITLCGVFTNSKKDHKDTQLLNRSLPNAKTGFILSVRAFEFENMYGLDISSPTRRTTN